MTGITELGYLRFGVSDLDAWRGFAGEVLGLEVGDDGNAERLYLRTDSWHHRIVLERDGSDDLLGVGLRVAGPEEFRAMQALLNENNVPFETAPAETARDRHVLELLTLTDPAGNPLEIFHGPRVDAHRPFHPGRPRYGRFVTGEGGLGHMILRHQGLSATYDFYHMLGMRGSIEYQIPLPNGSTLDILFMHCNGRDHTVAFGIPSEGRVQHVMLEVDTLDDVFHTYDRVRHSDYPVAVELGKHANDHMFSFYCESPSGFQIEIGWGGRPATHQSEYYVRDTYGHGAMGESR